MEGKKRVEIDSSKSALENANAYFEKAKKAREKLVRVRAALEESRKELEKLEKEEAEGREKAEKQGLSQVRIKRKKEWYDAFHFFFTPSGKLVIAGRSAKQNDLIYSRYVDEKDLFFHADIQGAPATVLKGGAESGTGDSRHSSPKDLEATDRRSGFLETDKLLVAQFAASFSSAWKTGAAGVDVYAVGKTQLAKHAQGGFIPKGGFAILGEREWFRKTPLGIKIYLDGEGIPRVCPERMEAKGKAVLVYPSGNDEKMKAAKKIGKLLSCEVDEVVLLLPSGNFRVVGWKKEEE